VPCGEVDFVADYEAALEAEEEDDDEEGDEGEGEDAMEAYARRMPLCALRRSYVLCAGAGLLGVNVNTDPHLLRVGQPCGCLCVSLGH